MRKPLLAMTMVLFAAGCAVESGYDARQDEYGVANAQNFAAQEAYGHSNARLRDLALDFAANTTDTVTFDFDRSSLDGTARAALDTQVAWLKKHPDVKMTIVGHADLVGSTGYNYALGLRRARSVLSYLARNGISRKRLAAISSRGETEPVVQTQERERRNRRVVTTVSGFIRGYVGEGMDGRIAHRIYGGYIGN